jgi:hypothetical protein
LADGPAPTGPALAGNAVSFFGYGLILPFEIIYLHQIRGFATATASARVPGASVLRLKFLGLFLLGCGDGAFRAFCRADRAV